MSSTNTEPLKEYWGTTEVDFIEKLPHGTPLSLVTAVKCYIFKQDELLLVNDSKRGWDVPGGHIEAGENSQDAIIRETREETGYLLQEAKLVGYLRCTQTIRDTRYPELSYVAVFICKDSIREPDTDVPAEMDRAAFFPINEAKKLHHNWTNLKDYILSLDNHEKSHDVPMLEK